MFRLSWLDIRQWRLIFAGAAVVAALWVWACLPLAPVLRVAFLDVGEGDAIVIRSPSGETALIDAGPGPASSGFGIDAGNKIVLPYLRRMGVNTLDAVVVTHPHDDHAGGMVSILRALDAKMVIDCGAAHASSGYTRLLKLIERKGIPFYVARRGDEIRLGQVVLKVLNPPNYRANADLNDRSIVLRAEYGSTSFLFTADACREAEIDMLENFDGLESTVLKVAHHGAKEAASEAFLAAVRPKVAVISVGYRNGFGHPARETTHRLERCGTRIYRTDRQGGITIESDGRRLSVSTSR